MKKICAFLMVLVLIFVVSGSTADKFTVSYTTYDTTYEKILNMYLRVINAYGSNNVGRHDLFNDAIYGVYDPSDGRKAIINATKKNSGYMLYDLNQDGIDELLIGSNGGYINSIFTMDNGRVRELIRAGGYGTASSNYTCSMLDNGMLFRQAHDGPADFYELWSMNGTGPVSFVEGYCVDYEIGANETGDPNQGAWFRLNKSFREYNTRSTDRVNRSDGEAWLRRQENAVWQKRFVPFNVLEKYPDDPWNLAMLSVNGSTTSTAKVNVRKEANDNSKLVASKDVGTYVRVLSIEGNYFKIAFGKSVGYIKREYLTPLTYKIPLNDNAGLEADGETPAMQEDADQDAQGRYPLNGKTNKNSVNVRKEESKKSKLVVTINKKGSSVMVKGESTDNDGVIWYEIEYKGKEGFVRNDFIDLEEPGTTDSNLNGELYGLVIKKLATRSGPSPRAEDTGTYSLKGQRIRVYSRAYDPIENAWWVKCDVPYHGEIRTLWAWYTRFDSRTLPLESIPIEENVQINDSNGGKSTGTGEYAGNSSDQISSSDSGIQSSASSVQSEYDSVTDKEASVFNGTLRVGCEGDSVFTLKSRLYDLQYFGGYVDDIFDDYTRTAVIKFQKENGLTADGVVGKETWTLLLSSKAKAMPISDAIYIDVIDHYEEIEVQKSRQVWDHDEIETVYYEDGTSAEITVPVYRTEYYTVMEQRPVYREELKENVSPSDND